MDNGEHLEVVSDLVNIAGRLASATVVVAGGDRIEDLKLVEAARDHGIIDRIILVGNKQSIARSIGATGITIAANDIVHAEDDDHTSAATVELIKNNVVDIVLKGNISTPIINRHMLRLAVRPTVSLASIFDAAPIANGRPMILTDAGVTTVCNFGRLTDLIRNAVDVAQVVMGIERPRVAILSANEKQVPSLPSTWLGLELAQRSWDNAVVCGPLSFDLATDIGSVEIKGLPKLPNAAEVAGRADILVCPGIDAANILYKSIASMAKYGEASIAGITIGFPVPYIILSRSDPLETRLQSIALCSIYAERKTGRKKSASEPLTVSTNPENILVLSADEYTLKGAVYSNEQCEYEFELPYQGDEEHNSLVDLIPEIKNELARRGTGSLTAIAGTMALAGEIPGLEKSELYIIPDASGDRLSITRLLFELSKNYKVPAYMSIKEAVTYTGPHMSSIINAARYAAASTGKPLDSLKYIVAHLDRESDVAVVDKGEVCNHVTYAREDFAPVDDNAAFLLNIAKEIGGAYVYASCDIEAIILTGAMLRDNAARSSLRRRVGRLAPVIILDKNMELAVVSSKVLAALKDNTQVPRFSVKE